MKVFRILIDTYDLSDAYDWSVRNARIELFCALDARHWRYTDVLAFIKARGRLTREDWKKVFPPVHPFER